MTKTELIEKMAEDTGATKTLAGQMLEAFIERTKEALVNSDEKVTIAGFGIFEKTHRKARAGRNPQTGEAIQIEASTSIKFKPSKALKEAV